MVSIRSLNGQPLAALGTTTGQDGTSTLGGHAGAEAVSLSTLALVGLIRTLHNDNLLGDINVNQIESSPKIVGFREPVCQLHTRNAKSTQKRIAAGR